MKSVLKTGEEFKVNSVFMKTENQVCISFAGITSYDELRSKMTAESLSVISLYNMDESSDCDVYEGFTTLVYPSTITEASGGTIDVVFTFQKEDETAKLIRELQAKVNALTSA